MQKKLNRNNISSIILTAAVLVLIGINAWLLLGYAPNRNASTGDTIINTYPLIDPARQFYKADDLIINVQPLRDYFNNKYEADPNISIYFEVLNTGANIVISKDAEFFPASLLKVPLIMAVAKRIEQGDWKWSDELELTEADKNKDFGELWKQPVGTRFTIEELVKQSLISSDNTAYFMLLNNLDPNEIVKVQKYLGILDFISNDLGISAKKYAPILRSLFSATYLTVENSEKILEWMSESNFNDYLAEGMPPLTKFSHKIGVEDERKSYIDAGIVYLANRPYILIVMVKNYNSTEAQEIIKDISQKSYNYITNYPQSAVK